MRNVTCSVFRVRGHVGKTLFIHEVTGGAQVVTSCWQQQHQDNQYNIDFISSLKFENEIKSSLALNDSQFRNYPIARFH